MNLSRTEISVRTLFETANIGKLNHVKRNKLDLGYLRRGQGPLTLETPFLNTKEPSQNIRSLPKQILNN